MRAREGDLIQTRDNVIFDVKGLVHPPDKIVAFPRYIPTPQGTRGQGTNLYTKVYNLAKRYQYLQQHAPDLIVFDPVFGETICEVPINVVTRHYRPVRKIQQLRRRGKLSDIERKAVRLTEKLKEVADIPWNTIGVSGSIMAGLFTLQSDIDPVVYGMANCRKTYAALERLLNDTNSEFKPYSESELRILFDFRSKDTNMTFEDFVLVEKRKAFQGKFEGLDYFVRFVKDWEETNEKYGDLIYKNSGPAKITAVVSDDSEALFTPCTYKLENVKIVEGPLLQITEVTSFRGRFCQQARVGEKVTLQGKVEHVRDTRNLRDHFRILVGGNPSDFLALSNS
jgi:predicted nucleotidyltransferase